MRHINRVQEQGEAAMRPPSTLQVKTVRGTPIEAYGHTLTPIARVTSAVKHHATIGADRAKGSGWGYAHTQPVALLEEQGGTTRSYPIPDRTRTVLGQMALVALIFPAICAAVIAVARWLRSLD
jgi:hypothetical protein